MKGTIASLAFGVVLFAHAIRADPIDDLVAREMAKQHLPGLSLAVIQDGKTIKCRGYGLASVELDAPASQDTLYEIASVTKPFTAVAVMILVEEGKVRLDAPVGQYVAQLPASWKRVAVNDDPHPQWTQRLRDGLLKLSRGEADAAFAPEFQEEFTRSNRGRALAARLERIKSVAFLESRDVKRWRGNRPGGVVDRLEYYRLVSGSRTQGYVFSVDAAGRILWIEIEEEPARLSEMEPGAVDDAPDQTRLYERLVLGWAAGRVEDAAMTQGLRQALTEETVRSFRQRLAGATGLRFLASRDTRGDLVSRFGSEVLELRYYKVMKPGSPVYVVCFIGADNLLADVDLLNQ